jgi:hypothetical protein
MLKKLLAPVSLHALCRGCGTCTTLASRRQHCLEVFSKVRQKLLSHTHIPGRPYHHGLLTVLIYIRAHILTVHMPHTASVVNHRSHKLTLFPIGFRGYHDRASTVSAWYPTSHCNLVPHLLGVIETPAHWSKRGYKTTLFNLVKFAKQTSLVSSCPRNPPCTLDHPTVCR